MLSDERSKSPRTQRTAFIGLGSNLGSRQDYLIDALQALQRVCGSDLQLRRVSSLYESGPVGPVWDQPTFYNVVAEVETVSTPWTLLNCCQSVEALLGRERLIPKGPRTIDLDLLLIDDLQLTDPRLTVPHPELVSRAFALVPLLELRPMTVDPRDGTLLCRYAGKLLNSQPIARLGSLPGYPAKVRLPAPHFSPPQGSRRSGSVTPLA